MDNEHKAIIEWDEYGYPTQQSLQRLCEELEYWGSDFGRAAKAFYAAIAGPCPFGVCGPENVEVRGEIIKVWGYHTMGWSGCESIIYVLENSFLWNLFLERYERGGHYYFSYPKEEWLRYKEE